MLKQILILVFLLLSISSGTAMAWWYGEVSPPVGCAGTIDLSSGCVQPMLR